MPYNAMTRDSSGAKRRHVSVIGTCKHSKSIFIYVQIAVKIRRTNNGTISGFYIRAIGDVYEREGAEYRPIESPII